MDWDWNAQDDFVQTSTSTDGALTWRPVLSSADVATD
jgi:hypothetical protein